jgi:hypothetical protein
MHNCAGLGCLIDPNRATRYQEQTEQDITVPAVKHKKEKQYILNTNMIRSSHLLQHLYGPIPQAPRPETIARKAAQRLEDTDADSE